MAVGAATIATAAAAAANSGVMYVILLRMVGTPPRWPHLDEFQNWTTFRIALQRVRVVAADPKSAPPSAGIRVYLPARSGAAAWFALATAAPIQQQQTPGRAGIDETSQQVRAHFLVGLTGGFVYIG
jgi:hypothetical protein